MTTKISGDNISSIANTGVNWNAVTVADGSTQLNASAGNGYFLDTNAGVIEVFLPSSPTRGDTIVLADYASNFATNNVLVNTGGILIDSVTTEGAGIDYVLNTNDLVVELVYVDSSKGWLVKENQAKNSLTAASDTNAKFISATGGTITTSGDYKTHVFTGDGCFIVSDGGNAAGSNSVEYLVVAGGGGGGNGAAIDGADGGGGGGAGGFRSYTTLACASPLNASSALPISATTYPVTVGGGGSGGGIATIGCSGSNSVFSTITSAGGGGGGAGATPTVAGNGGSGGGTSGGGNACATAVAGQGNTPPVSPPQGNPGGLGGGSPNGCGPYTPDRLGGGGGGAGETGTNATSPGGPGMPICSGRGGNGTWVPNCFFGPVSGCYGNPENIPAPLAPKGRYFAGGGGASSTQGGCGGAPYGAKGGGGGGGGYGNLYSNPISPWPWSPGLAGNANTGGGGAGAAPNNPAPDGAGGKGIVVIRYKFQ